MEFVLRFFESLGKALNRKLHFTLGCHLEGDRQTDCPNQTLECYICLYCNYQQDDWSEFLALAEFAYNNALSATTGILLFFVDKGHHSKITVHPEQDLSSAKARDFVLTLTDYMKNSNSK